MRMQFGSDSNAVHVRVWYSDEPHAKVSYRTKDIPALVEELSKHLPATNLNFWQAYQAMKRGEWVGNKNVHEGTHFAIVTDGEGKEEIRHFVGYSLKVLVTTDMLNSTTWYIVPKGPRYKVGDRFEDGCAVIREVVYVDTITHDYCVKITHDSQVKGIQCCAEEYLNTLTKLPS